VHFIEKVRFYRIKVMVTSVRSWLVFRLQLGLRCPSGVWVPIGCQYKLTRHFGTSTEWRRSVSTLETILHQIFTGAELSGHFGISAEIPRDTSAPSVKNTYDMGYCFVRIGLLLVLYAEICRSYN